ncbi:hypothetical protein JCM14076_23260 [Methylosoma difficile]
MQKAQVVAALGQQRLMLPIWVKAALAANDRLKLYLTVLQAASDHAAHPKREIPDFSGDMAATKLTISWLHELIASSTRIDDELFSPDLAKLNQCLAEELSIMAKPILETNDSEQGVAIFAKDCFGLRAGQSAKITRPLLPSAAPAVLLLSSAYPTRG